MRYYATLSLSALARSETMPHASLTHSSSWPLSANTTYCPNSFTLMRDPMPLMRPDRAIKPFSVTFLEDWNIKTNSFII